MSSSASPAASPNIVGVHYKVGRKIGEGSFGVIYEGINLLNNTPVAIKFESRKSEAPQLRDENRTYKVLQGCEGIARSHFFGQEGLHNILVIDLLGPSLEDVFDMCGRKFTIMTTCYLAKAMVKRIWAVHEKSLIYRDIKPDNFLTAAPHMFPVLPPGTPPGSNGGALPRPGPPTAIYLVDFGMAKYYRDPKTKQHIPYREKKSLSGTARYMSINTHLGREQSRRDDLESLGHVFFYFLRGSLPWQGLKAQTNKQKYEKIGGVKRDTEIRTLAEGCPHEFAEYLTYSRNLRFEEQPDYAYLIDLFDKCLARHGFDPKLPEGDVAWDWLSTNAWRNACASGKYGAAAASAIAAAANAVNPENARLPPSSQPTPHQANGIMTPNGTTVPGSSMRANIVVNTSGGQGMSNPTSPTATPNAGTPHMHASPSTQPVHSNAGEMMGPNTASRRRKRPGLLRRIFFCGGAGSGANKSGD